MAARYHRRSAAGEAVRRMRRAAALAAALAVLPAVALAAMTGPASVVDGDTIVIAGESIRLHGIDAPQRQQVCHIGGVRWACGVAAWGELVQLTAGKVVACELQENKRDKRIFAVCSVGGVDINGKMVATGWALADRRYSTDYVKAEESARAARAGIWRGNVVPPWQWRQAKRLQAAKQKDKARAACLIKGNINDRGELVYHVRGGRWYDRITIDTAIGERWFCSEAEAREAGWRRSSQ